MNTSYSPLLTSDTDHDTSPIHPLLPSHDLIPVSLLDSLDLTLHRNTIHLVQDEQDGGSELARAWGGNDLRDLISNPRVLLSSLSACLGGLMFGFDQGQIAIILVMPQFLHSFPPFDPSSNPRAEFNKGLMTSILELGALIGSLLSGLLSDHIGRKKTLGVGIAWFSLGSIVQVFAKGEGGLVLGRAVGGVGVGVLSCVAPLYVSEIAPPNIRGSLMVIEQFMIVTGVVVMFYITYATRLIPSELSFRLPFMLQTIPALLLLTLLAILPESPRWLTMQKGREGESLQVLSKLRGMGREDERVQAEWIGMVVEGIHCGPVSPPLASSRGKIQSGKWDRVRTELDGWKRLWNDGVRERTLVGVGVMFFQQMVGINALIYYSPTLFETLGLDYELRLTLSGLMNVVQLVAVVFTFTWFEKMGRKTWLFIGSGGMFIAHLVVAGIIAKYSSDWASHQKEAWVGVTFIFLFMLAYGISWGPIAWTLPSEVHSSSTRAKGTAAAVCTTWAGNFLVGLITPPLIEKTGSGAFVLFAMFAGLSGIWVYLFVPETRGKSLEQMDEVFKSATGREDRLAKREIGRRLMKLDDEDEGHDSDV